MANFAQDSSRTHPLVIVAATVLILTCLVALGVMTGILPFSRDAAAPDVATAPAPGKPGTALAPPVTSAPPAALARNKPAERAPVGSTSSSTAGGAVGSGAPGQTAATPPAPCTNCGTVIAVRTVKHQGDASMVGPAAGALLGGVLGHQIGHGGGNTIATVVGAGAGAAAGTEVERRYRSTTSYVIDVRMEDGSLRHFSSPTAPAVQAGARVKVVDGKLMMG